MRASLSLCLLVSSVAGACGGSPKREIVSRAPASVPARLTPPDPAPAVDGDVTSGLAGGVRVIVKRVSGAELAAGHLYVRPQPGDWSSANAGVEKIAFGVAGAGGPASLTRAAYDRRLTGSGASLGGWGGEDAGLLNVEVPVAGWDEAFALLAEAFLKPALRASDLEVHRARTLRALQQPDRSEAGPDNVLETLLSPVAEPNPASSPPSATTASVSAIGLADLASYLGKVQEKSRLLVVVVGDLDARHVFDQVRDAFGDLPQGSYVERARLPCAFEKARVVTAQRKLPTTYFEATFGAPVWRAPDAPAALLAVDVLSTRLFRELRTRRSLAYKVKATLAYESSAPCGNIYVTAADMNAALAVVLAEIGRLRDEAISDQELSEAKAMFLTKYLEDRETAEEQVRALTNAELYGGDWRLAHSMPERVRELTVGDIQAVARTCLRHFQAAVVGNTANLDVRSLRNP